MTIGLRRPNTNQGRGNINNQKEDVYLLEGVARGGLDLGVGVCQDLGQLRHDGGQRCAELLGGAISHGAQHLHAALLAAPGAAVHARHKRRQHQLHPCSGAPFVCH